MEQLEVMTTDTTISSSHSSADQKPSPPPRRTIALLGALAFTSTFSFGFMLYSVNTAMDTFRAFVNDSTSAHYDAQLGTAALEWLVAGLLCINTIGVGCGLYGTAIVAERYGRKGELES